MFMIAVFQQKTFCRFSNLQQIQLKDVFHDVGYLKFILPSLKLTSKVMANSCIFPRRVRESVMLTC
jgi:hypothetical protein